MLKYFLILYCEKPSRNIDQMVNDLKSLSDSKRVRWFHSDEHSSVIFHFSSNLDTQELKELIYLSFCQYSTFFILTEMTENTMLGMSQENMEHLLNIDDEPIDFEANPTVEQIEDMLDEMTVDGEIDSELLAMTLMSNVKKNSRIPTLNELLDKINEGGINSLNDFEKEILDSYSKK